ncbi:hypothetical protein RCL_jg24281.t1 [Rhizophagus clarus]|uniref:Uncharacterized protein n=1 Tax=Rhizophagus clarus TaxID=94130 RepID=A0A8H3MAU3_9GLOM|nr:hypothetical protein RCL_jg24281.t1 [Rhizophagus clarus]
MEVASGFVLPIREAIMMFHVVHYKLWEFNVNFVFFLLITLEKYWGYIDFLSKEVPPWQSLGFFRYKNQNLAPIVYFGTFHVVKAKL